MHDVTVYVDLAGSRLGPGYSRAAVKLDSIGIWPDEAIWLAASKHYDVPIEQVGPVVRHCATSGRAAGREADR